MRAGLSRCLQSVIIGNQRASVHMPFMHVMVPGGAGFCAGALLKGADKISQGSRV